MAKKQKETQTKPGKNGAVSFEFSIPWKALHDHYQIHLKEAAKTAEIKGFRKGKAPLEIVEKNIDKSNMYSHSLQHILPEHYGNKIQELGIEPVIEPRITPLEAKEGEDWKFKAETVVKPEVKLGNYKSYVKSAVKNAPKPKKDVKDNKGEDPRIKAAFDALLGKAEVEIAELLVEEETKSALSRLINQLEPLNVSVEDYAKSIKKTKEELIQSYKETALTNLKLEFILDAIIQKEKPTATKQEIDKLNPKENEREYAKYVVKKRKVIDNLLEL